MISIKLKVNKQHKPVFVIKIDNSDIEKHLFLKRAILEAEKIKGKYNYKINMRYFIPIINNLNKDDFKISKKSATTYFEFSDDMDEKYFYSTIATAKYMKTWREQSCPNIYKVVIDIENKKLEKTVAFKKINFSKR